MAKYRIQKRKGSSNIIEVCLDPSEKKPKWVPAIAPLLTKEKGDKLANLILTFLQ